MTTNPKSKTDKEFPFRSFQGSDPEPEELREELEAVYIYLRDHAQGLIEGLQASINVHDEVLTAGNEIVYAAREGFELDVVMVTGIPNS
jgi:hypothetical protein